MSKESKPADRWRQVFAADYDRRDDFCSGWGYFADVNGYHRADCTAPPDVQARVSTTTNARTSRADAVAPAAAPEHRKPKGKNTYE